MEIHLCCGMLCNSLDQHINEEEGFGSDGASSNENDRGNSNDGINDEDGTNNDDGTNGPTLVSSR
jgi:hypothetical protein